MSGNKKPRKAYRPRKVAVNTLEIALHMAAKPSREDRGEVLAKFDTAIQALCAGVATEFDWSIAAGALSVAHAIERQGVVRGLVEHLADIEISLQGIYDRCRRGNIWLRPTLSIQEVDAMRLLQELHAYQVNNLGRAEMLAAMDSARTEIINQGHVVTVARNLERLAA